MPGNLHDSAARSLAFARFDRVIGLITIAQGPEQQPPLFQIISVTPVPPGTKQGDPIQFQPAPSGHLNFGGLIINPMTPATAGRFTAIDGMARNEQHIATLARLWGAAEQGNGRCFSDPDRDACQVHYCKVIEQ